MSAMKSYMKYHITNSFHRYYEADNSLPAKPTCYIIMKQ